MHELCRSKTILRATALVDLKISVKLFPGAVFLKQHLIEKKLVSIRFDNTLQFGAGACLASVIFFSSLAFGARILSPLVSSRKAWQTLDAIIAIVMFVLAYSMFSEAF